MGLEFVVISNGINVAKIEKKRFNIKDIYKIDIYNDSNDSLFLSLVIAIDNSIHN